MLQGFCYETRTLVNEPTRARDSAAAHFLVTPERRVAIAPNPPAGAYGRLRHFASHGDEVSATEDRYRLPGRMGRVRYPCITMTPTTRTLEQ